jgi:hypothetical protein
MKLKKIKKNDKKRSPNKPGLTCQTCDPGHETGITP